MNQQNSPLSRFTPTRIVDGTKFITGVKIICAKCGKHQSAKIPLMKAGMRKEESKAIQFVSNKFRKSGWFVGKSAPHDVCEVCWREKMESHSSSAKIPPINTVNPERKMSRDDKRIIFEKINDVYIDERAGYSSPWTDERISIDLGVPRAWVASVREEMFGPIGSNDEINKKIESAERFLERSGQVYRALIDECNKLKEICDSISNVLREVKKSIGVI